ncbi:MAG TPA: dihydrodipicolinate synthase family protein [Trueperaceae bacterium]|nr:dihydrodipicolinate synthase family protein [Trueperaceae bacterium]
MSRDLLLPRKDGSLTRYSPRSAPPRWPRPTAPFRSRVAYAAAHVVKDPLAPDSGPDAIDWEATVAFRRHLWSYGLGVAEAMDTAQRGMGLDYEATKALITRACAAAREVGGAIVCGASTDQGPDGAALSLDDIADLYLEQVEHIEAAGGRVVVMASRHLARVAAGPEDYAHVYDRVLARVREPAVIHWLGEMFDPALTGYWGSRDVGAAMDACLDVIARHADKVEGIKLSLLDAGHEVTMRARLPAGVRMLTGDDFNYPELILGDGEHHSDALLGIFDAIAPAASAALQALDAGDVARYREALEPTVPLSRLVFEAPTFNYKTGVVFLAYLNGFQDHFRMVAGMESARNVRHLGELFVLADEAGVLLDPELAVERMRLVLRLAGVEA